MPAEPWFSANGRGYCRPEAPAVVVCLDGCEPAYLDAAIAAGRMPALAATIETGTAETALSVIPSFTNPNNLSIVTGRPPSVHGICGNFFFSPEDGAEVMMNDTRFLRAQTVFSAAQQAGARVAVVTAKDKLRALLGAGLKLGSDTAVCFSSERSAATSLAENGIDNAAAWLGRRQPDVYSAALSEFVFAAGVKLLEEFRPDIMYLTTTDFIQHKFAPDDAEAIEFHAMFDRWFADLDAAGAAVVITADHGMKPKHDQSGRPRVVYVQDLLDRWIGREKARVILPITDPYVVHHGSLGSFATVYLPAGCEQETIIAGLRETEGIDTALSGDDACARFELPRDRIGDIVLIAGENDAIGTTGDRHDLAALDAPLRSHGGLTEQAVPFIVNRRIELSNDAPLRNFDAFSVALRAAKEVKHAG